MSSSTGNSLAYLEDYLDTLEALPMEVTRQMTAMRELDAVNFALLTETKAETREFLKNVNNEKYEAEKKRAAMLKIMASFKTLINDGHEKIKIANQTYNLVDRHIRRLDEDLLKFEEEQMTGPKLVISKPDPKYTSKEEKPTTVTTANRPRRVVERRIEESVYKEDVPSYPPPPAPVSKPRATAAVAPVPYQAAASTVTVTPTSQPPRKANPTRSAPVFQQSPAVVQQKDQEIIVDPPVPETKPNVPIPKPIDPSTVVEVIHENEIDPNEPTYCLCDKVSFGEMIACDNDDCPREWFHYECVQLLGPVKGKWYCPDCSKTMPAQN